MVIVSIDHHMESEMVSIFESGAGASKMKTAKPPKIMHIADMVAKIIKPLPLIYDIILRV